MDTGSSIDPIDLYRRSAAEFDRVLAATNADQYAASTPCAGWDVRALVNHVVSGNLLFLAWGTGGQETDRSADFLGDDPLTAYRASITSLTELFTTGGFLGRDVQTPLGPGTGVTLIGMRFNELLVHSWDLAAATGQPTDLDSQLCAVSLQFFQNAGIPRGKESPFGESQPVPEEASAADRLAGYVGRTVTV